MAKAGQSRKKGSNVKITDVEAFQVRWAPDDKPAQHSAWVRVHCDNGLSGLGEASPMQGGVASLGIVRQNLAPALIGKDPLDHAVLQDTLLHTFVKLGPEGALTGALAAVDIALWDLSQPARRDCILFHAYDRWGFSEMKPSADDRYLRYVVARLAAFRNVWWSLANEYDLMCAKKTEDWERFAGIINFHDPVPPLALDP